MRPPRDLGWRLDPRLADDTHPVTNLELSELRLMDDANHPWLILVPRIEHAVEWIDLDAEQQAVLTREIDRCSRALRTAFQPHKLNVAALGNQVEQLHIHVIARYREDIAWPRPVWGSATALPYKPELLIKRIELLHAALAD